MNEFFKTFHKENPDPDCFTGEFCPAFNRDSFIMNLSQNFPQNMSPVSLISKPDKDITNKENYNSVSLMVTDTKVINKILADQIQTYQYKRNYPP